MHTFRAMNTTIVTTALPQEAQLKSEKWFAYVERKLSRFQSGSELSALNRSAGRPFMASALLYEILAEADRYYQETEGLFNPYLGGLIQQLGYSRSFELLAEPAPAAKASIRPETVQAPAFLEPGMRSIVLHPEASVDLGGIAKGWSAHQLSLMLRKDGIKTGAIGAGGDISFWGQPKEGWEVSIANPLQADQDIFTLHLQGTMGIATSSTVKRRWRDVTGCTHHHIIDPLKGTSAGSDLMQVTIFAPNLTEAEVYAKCVVILGAEAGMKWLTDKHPACAAIGILEDGSRIDNGKLDLYTVERSCHA